MQTNNNDTAFSIAGKVNFNTNFTESFMLNEAFKTLRSNLLFCGEENQVIVVTSTMPGEGKTTVSTELARSLSQIERKTLLIYGDMRKPGRAIKNREAYGLSELLMGDATLSQVVYTTQDPNLNVIFSGQIPENPSELLTSRTFSESINILKEHYDYIIIDSPPLLPVIDAALISVHCDGAVMVIASEKATIQEITSAKEQLEKSNCKILGAILNQTHDSVHSKYYGKRYGSYPNYYGKK